MAKQFLDASGLNQYTQALKNGTLVVRDSSNALYANEAGSVPAAGIQGKISMSNLPEGAIDRLVKVTNKAARLLLTAEQVQLGDSVQETDNGNLFLVVDESKLSEDGETPGSEDAFVEYTAGRAAFADDASRADYAKAAKDASNAEVAATANSVDWTKVQNKPTEFKPEAHTHGAADVSTLTGYTKASTASDVAATDTLLVALGKIEKKADDASSAATDHTHTSDKITAMTNYSKGSSYSAITTTDTLNQAVGKLEKLAFDSSAWDGIVGKPTEFTPANHDAAKVNTLSTYSKSGEGTTGDIATTDTLVKALAKLENKAEAGADTSIGPDTITAIINQTWTPTN